MRQTLRGRQKVDHAAAVPTGAHLHGIINDGVAGNDILADKRFHQLVFRRHIRSYGFFTNNFLRLILTNNQKGSTVTIGASLNKAKEELISTSIEMTAVIM